MSSEHHVFSVESQQNSGFYVKSQILFKTHTIVGGSGAGYVCVMPF